MSKMSSGVNGYGIGIGLIGIQKAKGEVRLLGINLPPEISSELPGGEGTLKLDSKLAQEV